MKLSKHGLLIAALVCFFLLGLHGQVFSQETQQAVERTFSPFSPTKEQKTIAADIIDDLLHRHYLKVSLDDNLSSQMLYRYLDELDPGHSYFYDSDIKEFEIKYRFKLDDALQEGKVHQSSIVAKIECGQLC